MVKLIAKATLFTGNGRYLPGDKLEATATEAEVMIAAGYAVEDTSKPAETATDSKPSGKKQSGGGSV